MYEYNAKCLKVVDGDTMDLDIDLGMEIHINTRVRLYGINTPEIHTKVAAEKEAGQKAMQRVIAALARWEVPLKIQTHKDKKEKYGRYLATIILPDGTNLNELLIKEGLAKVATYD
jgi:micrococcal nuclease